MRGKHSKESIEIAELRQIVKSQQDEICDLKMKYGHEFEKIKNICEQNSYGSIETQLRKAREIAEDNSFELLKEFMGGSKNGR